MNKLAAVVAVLFPVGLGVLSVQSAPAQKTKPEPPPTGTRAFFAAHCDNCHNGSTKQGNLNLTRLTFDTQDAKNTATWVKIHDRVRTGEMPPPALGMLPATAKANFLQTVAARLQTADDVHTRQAGRATWRRMNRYEYENTLRDLLGAPWLQIKEQLPEDGLAYHFNKVGDALDVSHVQMSHYLAAADYALRNVMAQRAAPPKAPTTTRYYARDQWSFSGAAQLTGEPERSTFPIIGERADVDVLDGKAPMTRGDKEDPARREQQSIGLVCSAYEPIEPQFDHFRAPVDGFYKIRVSAHSFWAGPASKEQWWHASQKNVSKGRTREPISLYSEVPPRQMRKLGTFAVGPAPTVGEMDVYLLKNETIRPDAVRLFRSRPGPGWFRNPLATPEGQPGVTFRYLEVVGPIYPEWPTPGQKLLFGDLPLKDSNGKVEVVSGNPDADSARLMAKFIRRAYRRPVQNETITPFVQLARKARAAGMNFADAQITAYSAVLCSPDFVTLEEAPGPLDNYALASRLSYFLWNSPPDATLRTLADKKQLTKPGTLRLQAKRLLADEDKSARFVNAFLDYWLDLRKVNNTSPDESLYPDYYLDDYLVESARDETRAFFSTLLRDNLPAKNLVSSNFVMVNDRLAQLYGLPNVSGPKIRRVTLPPDSPRGGLLTQASVLKITANGTSTSPVLRGVWINERILGQTVPPPPTAVSAVDPDTRGATTIREQLAKHRSDPSCNSCHSKIDPAGFALENFDVVGGWRENYRSLGAGTKVEGRGKNGIAFFFCKAQPVDGSGVLPSGQKFKNVRDLKNLLAKNERQIARNLVNQFVIYGTGAPIRFGDRAKVEVILDQTKPTRYGVRSLLYATLNSDLFRRK